MSNSTQSTPEQLHLPASTGEEFSVNVYAFQKEVGRISLLEAANASVFIDTKDPYRKHYKSTPAEPLTTGEQIEDSNPNFNSKTARTLSDEELNELRDE